MNNLNIKMIVFDVDGTLTEDRNGTLIAPAVKEKMSQAPGGIVLGLATNQGGVGYRYGMLQSNPMKDMSRYPTEHEARARIDGVADNLKRISGRQVAARMCFAFDADYIKEPLPTPSAKGREWSLEWRKPNPGMLASLMKEFGVKPEETLFVGDREEDKAAAENAGVHYLHILYFVKKPWPAIVSA